MSCGQKTIATSCCCIQVIRYLPGRPCLGLHRPPSHRSVAHDLKHGDCMTSTTGRFDLVFEVIVLGVYYGKWSRGYLEGGTMGVVSGCC